MGSEIFREKAHAPRHGHLWFSWLGVSSRSRLGILKAHLLRGGFALWVDVLLKSCGEIVDVELHVADLLTIALKVTRLEDSNLRADERFIGCASNSRDNSVKPIAVPFPEPV